MAENDSQSESREQQTEQRFSQEQYEMLMRCKKFVNLLRFLQFG